jgi:hypothetical protein
MKMAEHTISMNYHDWPQLSAGLLTYADISPAHYLSAKGSPMIPTPAMTFGTAVHRILESEDAFVDEYTMKPVGMDRRTKAGKEAYAEFESESNGKTIMDREDWERVWRIHEAYQHCPDPIIQLVRDSTGINECPIVFMNEATGMACRCKPDRLIEVADGTANEFLANEFPSLFNPIHNRIVVDFKTTSKVPTARNFKWNLEGKANGGFGYGLAAAHYLDGTKADAFLWIVLETSPPFTVTRFLLSPQSHDRFATRRIEVMKELAYCERTGIYTMLRNSNEETML